MPTGIYPRRVKRHAVTQPSDPSYRLIPLTRNQNALVDFEQFEKLSEYHWYADWDKHTQTFYAKAVIDGRIVRMSRFILACEKEFIVDHENHNGLDNRKQNLRKCSHSENCRNHSRKVKSNSGYKGVSKTRYGRWEAHIRVNRKLIYLGTFTAKDHAARIYDSAALKYFGEFAHLNFPNVSSKSTVPRPRQPREEAPCSIG